MLSTNRALRVIRDAFDDGAHTHVVGIASATLATVGSDDLALEGSVMVLVGSSLAALERNAEAIDWLEQGLGRLHQPGSVAVDVGWHHRQLSGLYLLTGRWEQAYRYADWLARPDQTTPNRLAATRALAHLAAVQGRFDNAHALVNAASDLALRSTSAQLEAIVEGDRSLVLVAQGRLHSAVVLADRVAPRLAAPSESPNQRWANAHAVELLTATARHAAMAGDLMTAQRHLIEVGVPVASLDTLHARGRLELAHATVMRCEGRPDTAAAAIEIAVDAFDRVGAEPAALEARLEQARIAMTLGHRRSAIELFGSVRAGLVGLGARREVAEVDRWLAAAAEPTPPSAPS